jgi:hypothetical protein
MYTALAQPLLAVAGVSVFHPSMTCTANHLQPDLHSWCQPALFPSLHTQASNRQYL